MAFQHLEITAIEHSTVHVLQARHRGRPLQFPSMIVGFPLPSTEILTKALIDHVP
jgi:hypothetical protein